MKQRGRLRQLTSNAAAMAIGTLSAQFVNFLMLPFLTSHMTSAEYGTVDLSVALVSLITPVASLSVSEAVLRFGMIKDQNRSSVVLSGIAVLTTGLVLSAALVPVLNLSPTLSAVAPLVYCLLGIQLITDFSGQYLRGQERVRLVATVGVIYALLVAAGNIIFVGLLGWGASGNLTSLILGGVASFGLLFGYVIMITKPSWSDWNPTLIKAMLRYSAPLTPNAILWWGVNSASRLVLLGVLGPTAVGMYAVAARIPTLLSLVTQVFWQAWQLSAIEDKDSPTRLRFQSQVLAAVSGTLFLATSLLLTVLHPVISVLVSAEFQAAWTAVPPLFGAAIFLALASFWGTEYRVQMNTTQILWSSASGAVIAIAANLLLVPRLGIIGAGIGTCLGYAAVWVWRVWDLRRGGWQPQGVLRITAAALVLGAQSVGLYLHASATQHLLMNLTAAFLIVATYRRALVDGLLILQKKRQPVTTDL